MWLNVFFGCTGIAVVFIGLFFIWLFNANKEIDNITEKPIDSNKLFW